MKITIYTINDCKFSQAEKEYLKSKNLQFEEKNLETNREYLTEMLNISNNFAGTPVTKIEKDDGQSMVIKGFTQSEFDAALGTGSTTAPAAEGITPPANNSTEVKPEEAPQADAMQSSTDTAASTPPQQTEPSMNNATDTMSTSAQSASPDTQPTMATAQAPTTNSGENTNTTETTAPQPMDTTMNASQDSQTQSPDASTNQDMGMGTPVSPPSMTNTGMDNNSNTEPKQAEPMSMNQPAAPAVNPMASDSTANDFSAPQGGPVPNQSAPAAESPAVSDSNTAADPMNILKQNPPAPPQSNGQQAPDPLSSVLTDLQSKGSSEDK